LIVCSCNILSAAQILETLQSAEAGRPSSVARAYRCLGCAPQCGRCVATVRALLAEAHIANVQVGCETCPNEEARRVAAREGERAPLLIAAE
jgi:bacterioferritin-associated ferredoxin